MNEILKKRIEEAAVEHAESIPQSDERKEYSREDFIAGAEYALNGENVFAIDSDNAYVAWFDETDKDWHELSEGQFIVPTHWMPIPKFVTKK